MNRLAVFAVSAFVIAAAPALGREDQPLSAYDGNWAVEVTVQRGACQDGLSLPIKVSNGTIAYNGLINIAATGRVRADGNIDATFTRNNEAMSASGRIGPERGSGEWIAPSRSCAGRWQARKL